MEYLVSILIAFGIVSGDQANLEKSSAQEKLKEHQEQIPNQQYKDTISLLDKLEG